MSLLPFCHEINKNQNLQVHITMRFTRSKYVSDDVWYSTNDITKKCFTKHLHRKSKQSMFTAT